MFLSGEMKCGLPAVVVLCRYNGAASYPECSRVGGTEPKLISPDG
jgi:hypothetical protein